MDRQFLVFQPVNNSIQVGEFKNDWLLAQVMSLKKMYEFVYVMNSKNGLKIVNIQKLKTEFCWIICEL